MMVAFESSEPKVTGKDADRVIAQIMRRNEMMVKRKKKLMSMGLKPFEELNKEVKIITK